MEQLTGNQPTNNSSGKRINSLRIVLPGVLLAGILAWYFAFQILSAWQFSRQMNQLNDSLFVSLIGLDYGKPDEDDFNEKLAMATHKLAILSARKTLSESDSVRILINLRDSIVSLMISGLTVHKAKMLGAEYPRWFSDLPPLSGAAWLSEPFRTLKTFSTIPHEPIVIRHAPADTLEAQSMPQGIPEPENTAVHFSYETNQHLLIHFSQVSGRKTRIPFRVSFIRHLRELGRIFYGMTGFTDFQYLATMNIYLSPQDALTIFRALPEKPAGALDY
jgi:hypothetical protein